MSIYLMDYENTKNFGGVERLKANDRLVIFYSQNSTNISIDDVKKIMNNNVTLEFKNVGVGAKNALDFQLSSYLGYVISTLNNKSEPIYIVSKDKGYETLVEFWKRELNIEIKTVINFGGESAKVVAENTKKNIKKVITDANLGLSQADVDKSINIINQFKTKTAINNNLNKLLKDSDKVGKILKAVKAFIKDKK